jgi:hypothetical protein
LYYQWYKDGAIIQNANQSSYTIGNVQIADEGLYSCLVSNQYGNTCSNAASLTVTFVSPPQIWGATTVPEWSVETYSVTQTIGSTYFFSVVNGNKINNTVNSITVQWGSTGWGQIICSETNYLGCTSAPALLDIAIGSVGILETGEKQILIAPNPTSGLFTLDSKLGLNKVSVYTYNGKLIFSSSVSTNPFQVDLSSYAKGIYFVRIATNGATITRKIIVF